MRASQWQETRAVTLRWARDSPSRHHNDSPAARAHENVRRECAGHLLWRLANAPIWFSTYPSEWRLARRAANYRALSLISQRSPKNPASTIAPGAWRFGAVRKSIKAQSGSFGVCWEL